MTAERCLEQCLKESDFACKSVNFDRESRLCELFDIDRHTSVGFYLNDLYFGLQTSETKDYLETNCVKGKASLISVANV